MEELIQGTFSRERPEAAAVPGWGSQCTLRTRQAPERGEGAAAALQGGFL